MNSIGNSQKYVLNASFWLSTRLDSEEILLKKTEKKIRPVPMLMDPNGRAGKTEMKPTNIS